MEKILKVEGMKCMHCAKHVEDACKSVLNVLDAKVSLESKTVTITYDKEPNIDQIKKEIENKGYIVKF